jgi:hypothetical protein
MLVYLAWMYCEIKYHVSSLHHIQGFVCVCSVGVISVNICFWCFRHEVLDIMVNSSTHIFPHTGVDVTSVRRWFCCLRRVRISWGAGLAWWTARFMCSGKPPRSQLSVRVARCLFTSRTLALWSSKRSCCASVHCSYIQHKCFNFTLTAEVI